MNVAEAGVTVEAGLTVTVALRLTEFADAVMVTGVVDDTLPKLAGKIAVLAP